DDVLMNAQLDFAQSAIDQLRLRQCLLEVAATLPQRIDLTAFCCQDHVGCRHSLPTRRLEAPHLRSCEALCVLFRYRKAHHVCGRHSAHFGAALHATVPADGHESCVWTPNISARKLKVHDRANVVSPISVLRNAHAPHHDGVACLAKHLGEAEHIGASLAGGAL